jgi:hypothetical protein
MKEQNRGGPNRKWHRPPCKIDKRTDDQGSAYHHKRIEKHHRGEVLGIIVSSFSVKKKEDKR